MSDRASNNIDLLKDSYANVQSVLRFLDTKAGVIFALAGAFVATAGSLAGGHEGWDLCGICKIRMVYFVIISGVGTLIYAIKAIYPAYGPKNDEHFSWLYPAMHPTRYKEAPLFEAPKFEQTSTVDLCAQYTNQLNVLVPVLNRKTKRVRVSLWLLGITASFAALDHILEAWS